MQTFGRYTIIASIHDGRETALYRAVGPDDGAQVVLKLPKRRPASVREVARLQHEHAILRELALPGVVTTLGLEHADDGVALVLAPLDGDPLDRLLAAGRLQVAEALAIASAIAAVLADIHARGVIHRDIKPANVIVGRDRTGVHIVDFGLATRLTQETQRPASPDALEGTLAYLAPEQTGRMNRLIDRRADLYSFGVTLYHMLTGVLPFVSDDPLELVHSHIARTPASPRQHAADIPEVVAALVLKLMAKAPEDRYQSARGLLADLDACIAQLAGGAQLLVLDQHEQALVVRAPQRVYGRAREVTALLEAVAHVRRGGTELVLVSGYAGIGKSALVHEIQPVLAAEGGIFVIGKFDQLTRNTPYAALVQTFRELVRHALGEREGRREALRAELARVLAGGAQVLTLLIPELAELLGPQPPVAELGPTEAQNRFHRLLDAFVQVFAGGPEPLVMFLDDLQWADLASLRLLQLLLAGAQARRLVVVAAYRDNEVGPAHPLLAVIAELRARGVAIREIDVAPLPVGDISDMLADLLGGAPSELEALARAIYRKTQGNPFFIGQFLRALQQDGALRPNPVRGASPAFTCELEALQAHEVTENVADFMDRRIRLRSEETQRVLRLAACIGHRFDLTTLAMASGLSPAATAAALWEALEEGLVLPEGADQRFIHHSFQAGAVDEGFGAGLDIAFRFSHDRVQQAAYALIGAEHRAATHLLIGDKLLAEAGGEPGGDLLFDVANHLNIGAALIDDPAQRRRLAALDLAAGRRAKASTAYAVALGYFRAGAELLAEPDATGPDGDPLRFALGCELAECTYLTGAFAEAEPLFAELLARAPSNVDRAAVYTLQLRMVQVAGRYDAGVDVGATALASFDVTLPADDAAMAAAMAAVLADIRENLAGREIAALLDAPRMTDPVDRAILGLLVGVMPCAYIGRPKMFPYLALKAVSFSLHHGNSEESCFAYSVYGFMLAAVFGEIPAGFAFSEMSIRLNERFGDAKLRGTLLHLHGDHINFWVRPLRTGLPILEQAFQACLEVGDLVYGSFLAFETVWQRFECGEPIAEVRRHSERFLAFAADSKNDAVHQTIRLEQQFLAALAGETHDETLLDDDDFSADACLSRIAAASFGCGVAFHHILRMMLLVLYGQPQAALVAAEAARGVLAAVMAMPIEATFYLFEALAIAAEGRATGERAAALTRLQDHLDRLALWARHCPENFEHKHLLVRAEAAWLADDLLAAEALYDDAIASARRHGFGQYEALASELCGQFYAARQRSVIAPVYLRAAHDGYLRWGALAKATQLARRLPTPAIAVTLADAAPGPGTHPSTNSSTSAGGWAFDLATVVRLGQALAGEIELDRLLDRLMRIVLQSAGGTGGALMLVRDGELGLAATYSADADSVQLHGRSPLPEHPELPATIVEHVARTREALVIADVSQDPRFAGDPALAGRTARSILCLALVHRRRLSGVLYVEHALARDAFNRERVELLEMLCSHAVSAVENALLYRNMVEMSAALARTNEHLEEEVSQRTTALSAANERLSAELQERERTERARAELQEEVIRMQDAMLTELSTPLIPITDAVMVMPLIGSLDARRSELVLQAVLEGAQLRRARVVILDVTGMKAIDTDGVAALVRTAQALRLIGAQALLTGLSPLVAQLLVELDVDLTGLRTYGSLQAGIAVAVGGLGGSHRRARG